MKKNLIFIVTALYSNPMDANSDIHQLLGISATQKIQHEPTVTVSKSPQTIHPEKKLPNDPTMRQLLAHTKVKKTPQKEICCGIKMDYKLSKKLSLSVDLMAQVEEKSYKIKSKEANLHLAISL